MSFLLLISIEQSHCYEGTSSDIKPPEREKIHRTGEENAEKNRCDPENPRSILEF